MDDFLAKPISLRALRAALERYLESTASAASDPVGPISQHTVRQPPDARCANPLLREIMPLLAQNKFSAFARVKELMALAKGTTVEEELAGVQQSMDDMCFDLALRKLQDIAAAQGWLKEGE